MCLGVRLGLRRLFCEALVALALAVGLGPGLLGLLGDGCDLIGVCDQCNGFFYYWIWLEGWFGRHWRSVAAGLLDLVEPAFSLMGFAAEANSAATQPKGTGKLHIRGGRLA